MLATKQFRFPSLPVYGQKTHCVPQKKVTHTGLEWHEGEEKMTEFNFWGDGGYPFQF